MPLDPQDDRVRQGYILLGNAERSRGRPDAAVAAWEVALRARFDATLALDVVTLELEREGHQAALAMLARIRAASPGGEQLMQTRFLTGVAQEQAGRPADARAAWQEIIDNSPADAPWVAMLQRRMERLPP